MSTWTNRPSTVTIPIFFVREDEDLVNYYEVGDDRPLPSDVAHELYEADVRGDAEIVLHLLNSGHESRDESFISGYDRQDDHKAIGAWVRFQPMPGITSQIAVQLSSSVARELAEFFAAKIQEVAS